MKKPDSVQKLQLGLWTVSRLHSDQILGIAERKLRHIFVPRIPVDFDERYESQIPAEPKTTLDPIYENLLILRGSLNTMTLERCAQKIHQFDDYELELLNINVSLSENRTVEWGNEQLSDVPLLWWLKYSSLEQLDWFLFAEKRLENPEILVEEVLDPWTQEMESRTVIGSKGYLRRDWIPHAVSLRIMRLCRYCAWLDAHDMLDSREFLLQYLYKNTLFLRNHIETDVGGNHLIENALALTMSGLVFQSEVDWLRTGLSLFEDAGQTQFLDDGGHYERSPMYHIMVLTRFLSAIDLLDKYQHPTPSRIHKVARSATQFIRSLAPPDGHIPLLNDAVFNEFLSISEVLNYANSIGVSFSNSSSHLPHTGYYWLGEGADRLLFDVGAIGPSHLPGHSHIDLLSILLWIDNKRVLTDTGVYHYDSKPQRTYARSVEAHNTVQVGSTGPIEVGGQYLIGRRTEPIASIENEQSLSSIIGKYRVNRLLSNSYTHIRKITNHGKTWEVADTIESNYDCPTFSRLHFHPKMNIKKHSERAYTVLTEKNEEVANIHFTDCKKTEIMKTPYYPRFGTRLERACIECTYTGQSGKFSISKVVGSESIAFGESPNST